MSTTITRRRSPYCPPHALEVVGKLTQVALSAAALLLAEGHFAPQGTKGVVQHRVDETDDGEDPPNDGAERGDEVVEGNGVLPHDHLVVRVVVVVVVVVCGGV